MISLFSNAFTLDLATIELEKVSLALQKQRGSVKGKIPPVGHYTELVLFKPLFRLCLDAVPSICASGLSIVGRSVKIPSMERLGFIRSLVANGQK